MRKTRWKMPLLTMLFGIGLSGCFGTNNRVVYVRDGTPMKLAEPVKASVWVKDADGKPIKSDNKVEIPEGWMTLPDPGLEKQP